MITTRLATATLVAVVALTCDITEVEGPPADNPDAEPQLTPQDRLQDLVDQLNALGPIRLPRDFLRSGGTPIELLENLLAYQDVPMARYESREGEENRTPESTPLISPIAPQIIVESDSPSEADLVLADEPLVRVGMLDGPDEHLFGNISGAIRLEDGSVVVADEQSREVRMFDAGGGHVWTSGREGEGPGEYQGLWLLRGCPGAATTVYDWRRKRITELDSDGSVADTRALRGAGGPGPYGAPACSPAGDLVFTDWPKIEGGRRWPWVSTARKCR